MVFVYKILTFHLEISFQKKCLQNNKFNCAYYRFKQIDFHERSYIIVFYFKQTFLDYFLKCGKLFNRILANCHINTLLANWNSHNQASYTQHMASQKHEFLIFSESHYNHIDENAKVILAYYQHKKHFCTL